MTLSPQWLDELRARTTLSAIIAPTVKLTKAGREEYDRLAPEVRPFLDSVRTSIDEIVREVYGE